MKLSRDQSEALLEILRWAKSPSDLLTLGGLAGTGKTTLLGEFAKNYQGLIAYATVTGRASSVLARKLKAAQIEASNLLRSKSKNSEQPQPGAKEHYCGTIHRLIYQPIIDETTEEVLGYKKRVNLDRLYRLIVIDEASMVSDEMLEELKVYGIPIFAIGDHGQLPPIAASGSVVSNPHLRLEKIHRQASGNPIIAAAHAAREGAWISDVCKILGQKRIPHSLFARDAGKPIKRTLDFACIVWKNETRVALNRTLRKAHNFSGPPREGEVVIALRNDPPVYNGMRGIVAEDCLEGKEPWLLDARVGFPDEDLPPSPVTLNAAQFHRPKVFQSVEDLRARGIDVRSMKMAGMPYDFGYAMTCHKCQGSQFGEVDIYFDRPERPGEDDYRRWFYTALTRASERVTIYA
jgi:exodeoxyribonuclease V